MLSQQKDLHRTQRHEAAKHQQTRLRTGKPRTASLPLVSPPLSSAYSILCSVVFSVVQFKWKDRIAQSFHNLHVMPHQPQKYMLTQFKNPREELTTQIQSWAHHESVNHSPKLSYVVLMGRAILSKSSLYSWVKGRGG